MQPHSEDHINDHQRGDANSTGSLDPSWNARFLNGFRLVRHSPVWRQNSSTESIRAPQMISYALDHGLQFLLVVDLVFAFIPEEQAEVEQLDNVGVACAILNEIVEPVKERDA